MDIDKAAEYGDHAQLLDCMASKKIAEKQLEKATKQLAGAGFDREKVNDLVTDITTARADEVKTLLTALQKKAGEMVTTLEKLDEIDGSMTSLLNKLRMTFNADVQDNRLTGAGWNEQLRHQLTSGISYQLERVDN